jgi:hypothetical protein
MREGRGRKNEREGGERGRERQREEREGGREMENEGERGRGINKQRRMPPWINRNRVSLLPTLSSLQSSG